jgi:hypothetical protein
MLCLLRDSLNPERHLPPRIQQPEITETGATQPSVLCSQAFTPVRQNGVINACRLCPLYAHLMRRWSSLALS